MQSVDFSCLLSNLQYFEGNFSPDKEIPPIQIVQRNVNSFRYSEYTQIGVER